MTLLSRKRSFPLPPDTCALTCPNLTLHWGEVTDGDGIRRRGRKRGETWHFRYSTPYSLPGLLADPEQKNKPKRETGTKRMLCLVFCRCQQEQVLETLWWKENEKTERGRAEPNKRIRGADSSSFKQYIYTTPSLSETGKPGNTRVSGDMKNKTATHTKKRTLFFLLLLLRSFPKSTSIVNNNT